MANPSSVGLDTDYEPAIIATSTTAVAVTLDPNKQYMLVHNGINASGASTTDYIMGSIGSTTPAASAGSGKLILTTATYLYIGPGHSTLNLKASANAPTVSLIPIENDFGNH